MDYNILLIGDSFGVERFVDKNNKVLKEETWPVLFKSHFESNEKINIDIDFKAFRLLDECIDIINNLDIKYNLIVIEAGLVDCFPRPLPKYIFRSTEIYAKIFRKLISKMRIFWLKFIYSKPLIPAVELEKKLLNIISELNNTKFLFITITDQYHKEAIETQGYHDRIKEYNDIFYNIESNSTNIDVYDLYSVKDKVNYSSLDSHLTKVGNYFLFNEMKKYTKNLIQSKSL